MINTWKTKKEQRFYRDWEDIKEWRSFRKELRRSLRDLDLAKNLNDLLALPGNRLRKLEGAYKGNYYRIWVNKQYRIIFRWGKDNNAYEVEISKHKYKK